MRQFLHVNEIPARSKTSSAPLIQSSAQSGGREILPQYDQYSTYAQSYEQALQEATKASEAVSGEDRQDGWVQTCIEHREIVPVQCLHQ
jgi:hypothetical protein